MNLSVGENTSTLIAWDYNRQSGAFGVELAIPDGILAKVSGLLKITENEFVLTVKKIKVAQPSDDRVGTAPKFRTIPLSFRITLTGHSTEPLPEPPVDYADITEMSKKEREYFSNKIKYDWTLLKLKRYLGLDPTQ